MSDDAGIWFLYTPVICTRLYSVLLAIWKSRPNTVLPQHQGATGETYDESLDAKEIALGPGAQATLLLAGYRGHLVRQ